MASVAEPEVQFAQRLASNEKPLRRKALKKLRSYITARSRTQTGFSEEELLKLWKGLFYCLWMQDKPLLQEELSTQISGLVHHFHSFSAQLLYLQTFLATVKREWTGIDRQRMDKYFQLVRFMFRQMFEVLQRSQWEPSCIRLFLDLLSSELLQTGVPPVGLQLHVLDLYLRELAVVGAQELSADQNLIFIEPFCKTAAKTKDRSLFQSICSSVFSTIIDQAPFAIQELMEELQQDSDSGQASDDADGPEEPERGLKNKKTKSNKTKATKRVNGLKAHSEEDEDDDDDDDGDDGLSDSEKPFDEDVGPVLQFDYGALADKLLELSSRHNTPSRNRQRLYKIIRVLRDLSQGSFPQDEYPEEVSTDEDDDDFGSRKRMKRRHPEEEEEEPEVKRTKGKKKNPLLSSSEPSNDVISEEVKKKNKRKKKKKKPQSQADVANSNSMPEVQPEVLSQVRLEPSEPSLENGHIEIAPKEAKKKRKKTKKTEGKEEQTKVTEENSQSSQSSQSGTLPQTQELSEIPAGHLQEEVEDTAAQKMTKKRKKKKSSVGSELEGAHQEAPSETLPQDTVPTELGLKKASNVNTDDRVEVKRDDPETPVTNVKAIKKRKRAGQKKSTPEAEAKSGPENQQQKEALEDIPNMKGEEQKHQDSSGKTSKKQKTAGQKVLTQLKPDKDAGTEKKKKKDERKEEEKSLNSEILQTPAKTAPEEDNAGSKKKRKKRKIPVEFEYEADEVQGEQMTPDSPTDLQTPLSKPQKIQKKPPAQSDFVSFQSSPPPAPLFCRARGPHTPQAATMMGATPKSDSKKVRFGLKKNQTAEFRKSDRSLLLSPEGTSRVPFDPEQKPKCGVLKSPPTPFPKQKKKTPTAARTQNKKKTPVSKRPTAADFF